MALKPSSATRLRFNTLVGFCRVHRKRREAPRLLQSTHYTSDHQTLHNDFPQHQSVCSSYVGVRTCLFPAERLRSFPGAVSTILTCPARDTFKRSPTPCYIKGLSLSAYGFPRYVSSPVLHGSPKGSVELTPFRRRIEGVSASRPSSVFTTVKNMLTGLARTKLRW